MKTIVQFFISVVVLALVAYGVVSFFNLPAGDLVDWAVGVASFLWLMAIVTVPWNAHFKAKEVLDDAEISQRKDIYLVDEALQFTKKVAKRSLIIAISLHIFSAIALYMIALFNVSEVGSFAAIAALLLTFLRPSVRFYEYLNTKLSAIRQEFRYPREDMHELLNRVEDMKMEIENIRNTLDTDPEKPSWRNSVDRSLQDLLLTQVEQEESFKQEKNKNTIEFASIRAESQEEFVKVRTENQQKFAQVTADSKVLDSVREIANFIRQLK